MPNERQLPDEGFYRVPVSTSNGFYHEFYFYRTRTGEFDLRYQWDYLDHPCSTLEEAVELFRAHFSTFHKLSERGITMTVGAPVNVAGIEVEKLRPPWLLHGP